MDPRIEPPLCYSTYQSGRLLRTQAAPRSDDTRVPRLITRIDSSKVYTTKPTKKDVAAISRRIMENGRARRVTPEGLAQAISWGYSVLGGVCIGKRSPDYWAMQQVWCIDVDNDVAMVARGFRPLDYTDAVLRALRYRLPLLISYETFSSDPDPNAPPERQRYRLLFAKAKPVCDRMEAEVYGKALLAAYPEADKSTIQLNRIFYGTDKEVLLWNSTKIV